MNAFKSPLLFVVLPTSRLFSTRINIGNMNNTTRNTRRKHSPDDSAQEDSTRRPKKIPRVEPRNAFSELMHPTAGTSHAQSSTPHSIHASHGKKWGKFAFALWPYCQSPSKYPKEVVYYYDNDVVVINDQYPKAKYHFLVMPRIQIDGLDGLRMEHLPLLEKIKKTADRVVEEIKAKDPGTEFKVGYHAVPSMKQHHLHIISTDLCSEKLKTKKHWNSFTTKFFLPFDQVREMLETKGMVDIDEEEYEELLKQTMWCERCQTHISGPSKIQEHVKTHLPSKS